MRRQSMEMIPDEYCRIRHMLKCNPAGSLHQ